MRQFAAGLNRTWLAVVGLVLLLVGLAATAVGTGLSGRVISGGPAPDEPMLGVWAGDFFSSTLAIIGVGLLGLLVALVGVRWLLAQLPRTNAAQTFRLQDDATTGLTSCAPSVLTDAVAADLKTLTGVTAADAVLRGTADEPELTVKVTANDRADVPALLQAVQAGPVANLAVAMGAPLTYLGVQVDISPLQRTSDSVTL